MSDAMTNDMRLPWKTEVIAHTTCYIVDCDGIRLFVNSPAICQHVCDAVNGPGVGYTADGVAITDPDTQVWTADNPKFICSAGGTVDLSKWYSTKELAESAKGAADERQDNE